MSLNMLLFSQLGILTEDSKSCCWIVWILKFRTLKIELILVIKCQVKMFLYVHIISGIHTKLWSAFRAGTVLATLDINKAKTKFHLITRRQYDSTERGQFFQGWIVLAILQNFVQFLIFFLAASTSLERSEAVKRDYCKYFQTSPCRKIFKNQICWEIHQFSNKRINVNHSYLWCSYFPLKYILIVMFIFPPQIHIDKHAPRYFL